MAEGDGLRGRMDRAVEELDVDFGGLTAAGWAVSLSALAGGALLAFEAYRVVGPLLGGRAGGTAAGMTLVVAMIGVFVALRLAFAKAGVPIVKPPAGPPFPDAAGADPLAVGRVRRNGAAAHRPVGRTQATDEGGTQ